MRLDFQKWRLVLFFKLNYLMYLKSFSCSFGMIILVSLPALAENIKGDAASFSSVDRTESTLVQNSGEEVDIFIPEDKPRDVDGTFKPEDLDNNNLRKRRTGRCKSLRLFLDSQISSNLDAATEVAPIPARFADEISFINRAWLLSTPRLGENTCLKALAGTTFVHSAQTGDKNNYNLLLNLGLGIEQEVARDTYFEVGWSQDLFFQDGKNTSLDNSVLLTIFRQNELKQNQLWLDLSNRLQVTFSDVDTHNRISNISRADLFYKFTPRLFGGLNYQLNYDTYTINSRNCEDRLNQQLGTEMLYNLTSDGSARVSASAGYRFGSTCNYDRDVQRVSVDFNNFVLGIRFVLDLSLFD